jgi:hypothetical protein
MTTMKFSFNIENCVKLNQTTYYGQVDNTPVIVEIKPIVIGEEYYELEDGTICIPKLNANNKLCFEYINNNIARQQ